MVMDKIPNVTVDVHGIATGMKRSIHFSRRRRIARLQMGRGRVPLNQVTIQLCLPPPPFDPLRIGKSQTELTENPPYPFTHFRIGLLSVFPVTSPPSSCSYRFPKNGIFLPTSYFPRSFLQPSSSSLSLVFILILPSLVLRSLGFVFVF